MFSIALAIAVAIDPLQPQLNPWVPLLGNYPMDPDLFGIILSHTAYSALAYVVFRSRSLSSEQFAWLATATDVLFAAAVAFVTEGRSVLFTPFFTFPIVESGARWGLRRTMGVTCASVMLWFAMIVVCFPAGALFYIMRPVYLFTVGYLVGYLGEARLQLQAEVQTFAAAEDRLRIARDLHDGCAQVLSAINLQLESCKNLALAGRTADLLDDLDEMQRSVNAEHDELRAYLRTLAGIPAPAAGTARTDPRIRVSIDIAASGAFVDQVLRIVREGVTNIRRHAAASTAVICAGNEQGRITIAIDDDGCGFGSSDQAPWSIASRVQELGGSLRLETGKDPGAHIAISLPAS